MRVGVRKAFKGTVILGQSFDKRLDVCQEGKGESINAFGSYRKIRMAGMTGSKAGLLVGLGLGWQQR